MTIWEDIARALGGNVEYSYPTGDSQMAKRSLDYFMPKNSPGIVANDLPPPPIAPQETALGLFNQQPQAPQHQSQIPAPYNMLERVFLGAGGQGAAVQADKDRYQLAKLAESIPADPQDSVGTALRQFALQSPEGAKSYLEYALAKQKAKQPDWEVKEVNGKLVKYDKNNPTKVEGLGGDLGIGADVKGEGELRKEFDGLNKDYRVVNDAYNRIQNSAGDPSPAGDLALIFSYMKILDPSSTVREGEFANAQNAAGVPTQIQNLWNRAKTGERLQPEQRADFLRQAKNLYEAQAKGYQEGVKKYRGLATDYGYNPDRIVKPLDIKGPDPLAQRKDELRAKIAAIKKQKGIQ